MQSKTEKEKATKKVISSRAKVSWFDIAKKDSSTVGYLLHADSGVSISLLITRGAVAFSNGNFQNTGKTLGWGNVAT